MKKVSWRQHLFSENWKRRKKPPKHKVLSWKFIFQNTSISCLCSLGRCIGYSNLHMGWNPMKKFFEITTIFIVKLDIFKTYLKESDIVLVAEESKGWRTQPSSTDQDKSKFQISYKNSPNNKKTSNPHAQIKTVLSIILCASRGLVVVAEGGSIAQRSWLSSRRTLLNIFVRSS